MVSALYTVGILLTLLALYYFGKFILRQVAIWVHYKPESIKMVQVDKDTRKYTVKHQYGHHIFTAHVSGKIDKELHNFFHIGEDKSGISDNLFFLCMVAYALGIKRG